MAKSITEASQERLRYYIYNDTHAFDEDQRHEFKGHRNIVQGEIPPNSAKYGSRAPISKTINAFLNTGKGGTIYCGIVDDGTIKGLTFSPYQMDHMLASVRDCLNQYNPYVPKHRWNLEFIPVYKAPPTQDQLIKLQLANSRTDLTYRDRPHVIATHHYCWCDKDAIAAFNNGVLHMEYVAEIQLHPWSADNPEDVKMISTKTKIPPLHQSDDGKVYFRQSASVHSFALQDVLSYTKAQVTAYYTSRNKKLTI